MKILVTGGAGFIGSALIRHIIGHTDHSVANVDKLTYAGNLESLESVAHDPRYAFEHLDICDARGLADAFARHRPDAVMHLAAESHVDRSIDGPAAFVQTNLVGTYALLETARAYWNGLDGTARAAFRFHHHDHRAFGNRLTLEFLVLAGLAGQERHRRIESKHFVDDRARVDKPRHVGERWQPSAEYCVKLGM